ncbi:hypothetical protein BBP40_006648 [Aspergillus hancockii]|nr:hypothetical protein BBP40_006648 [Aspergillus hancockii]
MESLRSRRKAAPASLDVKSTTQFYPSWTVVQKKRQSESTDFDDTDFEYGSSDEESPRRKLPTPDNAPKDPFSFRVDGKIEGPSGPHLFRSSIASYGSAPSTAEIDVYFERSPIQSQLVVTPYSGTLFSETPSTQSQFAPTATSSAQSQFLETPSTQSQRSLAESSNSRTQNSETPSYRSQFSESQGSTFQYSEPPSAQTNFSETSSTQLQFSVAESPNSRSQFSEPPSARSFYSQTSSTRPQLSVPQTPNSRTQYSEPPSARSQFSERSTQSQLTSETPYSRTQLSASEVSMNRYQFSPCTPKAFPTVHPDVSQVEESEIRGWMPNQVAHWMHIAGYEDYVIEKFLMNDITGSVLITLQIEDLKELGIQSFGKRHQLMSSIDHLRKTMRKTPDPEVQALARRISYAMSVSPTGEVLSREAIDPDGGRVVVQGESVSIVGIEQVLPKPHNCSKGEKCPKYRRRQRQLEKLAAEFPDAVLLPGGSVLTGNPGNPDTAKNLLRPKSDAEPSIVASSDIFGPAQETPRLCEEALNGVQKLDPQESIRQFLSYQHVDEDCPEQVTEPALAATRPAEPVPALSPPTTHTNHMAANLRSLPKLQIPTDYDSDELTTAVTTQRTITPSAANRMYGSPTAIQQYGPFSSLRHTDHYRQGTPFSEMDAPITAIPNDPIGRETSQSVPPDMRYGTLMQLRHQEQAARSGYLRPQPSPPLRRIHQGRPLTPIEDPADLKKRSPRIGFSTNSSSNSSLASDPEVIKSGYMKKRKQARFLRHEWQDAHFTLRGTNLDMHKDELAAIRNSKALDTIDVDDYAVACSSLASSSKLTAAFKRSILRNGNNISKDDAAFAFSLIPSTKENEKKAFFGNSNVKSHHFAVKTRDERIDWMRELMLSKALKKGREGGAEMQVNGNFI